MSFLKMIKGAIVGLEEPKYEVVSKTEDFELRAYEEFKVVTLDVRGKSPGLFDRTDSKRLYDYLGGKNDSSATYDMTSPFFIHISTDENQKDEFSVTFILPHSAEEPAKPVDEGVMVDTVAARQVYTRRFGGMAKESDWKREYEYLKSKLDIEATDIGSYTRAFYDPPFKPFNRRNEVWINSPISLK